MKRGTFVSTVTMAAYRTCLLPILLLGPLSACNLTKFNNESLAKSPANINHAPIGTPHFVDVLYNTSTAITLSASDVDEDALSFSVVTEPAHGILSGTAPDVVYTPDDNFKGSDSFSFKANDGENDSEAETITLSHVVGLDLALRNFEASSPNVDHSRRSVTFTGLPSGRILSFNLNEDGLAASGLSCSNLPSSSRISANHLHLDLGIQALAGDLNLSCQTTEGPIDIHLAFAASLLTVVSSSFNESPVKGSNGQEPAQSPDGRYIAWQVKGISLNGQSQIALKDTNTGVVRIVSTTSSGADADDYCDNAQITPDGRFVLFSSRATNLVSGVTDFQIYRKDTLSGAVVLVSSSDGTAAGQGDVSTRVGQFSADGNTVVFASQATTLIAGASGGQVYKKDLLTGTISLVSSGDGTVTNQADHSASQPQVTADGHFVVFESNATNLVAGTSGWQIFRKDLQSGTIVLVSSSNGTAANQGDGGSHAPQITADGRWVFFSSSSSNFVAGTTNDQIFRKDLNTGIITLVSSIDGTAAQQANNPASAARISTDGTWVVFKSDATNFVTGATGTQIYRKNLQTGSLSLVSSTDGTAANQGNQYSQYPQISADGRFAVFQSDATNLVAGVSNSQIFRKDFMMGTLTLVHQNDGAAAHQASEDASSPQISANGRYVVFESWSINLISGVYDSQLYRKDLQTGDLVLVSSRDGTSATQSNSGGYTPQITPDGRFVVFVSMTTDLVANTGGQQVYLKDLQLGAVTLVSSTDGTAANKADNDTFSPQITADGRFVLFGSHATNLITGVSGYQIYLKDLQSGSIRLVSSLDGTIANQANDNCAMAQITPDGHFIVFESLATNLIAGVNGSQIYLKNLQNEDITLVSSTDGTGANRATDGSYSAVISADARYVLFLSFGTNLVAGADGLQLYRKDLQTGAISLVSSVDGTAATRSGGSDQSSQITSDGRYVVFSTDLSAFMGGPSGVHIYLKDLFTNALSTVDTVNGELSGLGNQGSVTPQISADGHSLVFASPSTNLVSGISGGERTQIYLRTLP